MTEKISDIKNKLQQFPTPVVENFNKSLDILDSRLSKDNLEKWAEIGLDISALSVRSWESATEYFKSSPSVQRQLPAGQLMRWARTGLKLSNDSPNIATAYFKYSPQTLLRLRPRYIDDWANICRSLYRGTWKSSSLSVKIFQVTPQLLETLNFEEFYKFVEFLALLSKKSYDQANESLDKSIKLFPLMTKEIKIFLETMKIVTAKSWKFALPLLNSIEKLFIEDFYDHKLNLINLSKNAFLSSNFDPSLVIYTGSKTFSSIELEKRNNLMDITENILRSYPDSVIDFLNSVLYLSDKITFEQILRWQEIGFDICDNDKEKAKIYYSIQSQESIDTVDSLSSSIELSRVRDILELYCQALSGKEIKIEASQNLVDKNIGWFEGDLPTTEGSTVYLPSVISKSTSKEKNFNFLKVISTHQVSHIEFGSFLFTFDKNSTFFPDIRADIENSIKSKKESISSFNKPEEQAAEDKEFLTHIGRFFDLFQDRKIALDIFTIVESTRVDYRTIYEYPGIAKDYLNVQLSSLENRPEIIKLPVKEAILELLIRISLGQKNNLKIPKKYKKESKEIIKLLSFVRNFNATVEDSSEITIRIYHLLYPIENEPLEEDEYENFDNNDEDENEDQDNTLTDEEIIQQFMDTFLFDNNPSADQNVDESTEQIQEDQDYNSPQEVDYRGEFKPELSELLSQMEFSDELSDLNADDITQEQLQEMIENSPEMDHSDQQIDEDTRKKIQEMTENLLKEISEKDNENKPFTDGQLHHIEEDGGELDPTDNSSFVYDEWDFRANNYKSNWCVVNEKSMTDGDSTFFYKTLSENSYLMNEIKKQFELVVPEMYKKQKRLIDGEEFDLDSVLEAIVDIRAGTTPDEKLYWRRNKAERSVAVSFLLDMSASTAEAIDEHKNQNSNDWGAPDDPVEYMAWLRSRRSEGLRKTYKRIIDVEKEGIVMMVNALETLGDSYGIYGFSGYGRENVEFYVIKDLEEKYSDFIPKRIDRIAPLHATRMGPAIRHTIKKLDDQESKLKILFLISDGRPQDRGYSREGVEKEYAVHDTRKALIEAREKGIVPFCLTVDKSGHDYMKVMMDDFNYEVLPDISQLPIRLPQLYKNLTT